MASRLALTPISSCTIAKPLSLSHFNHIRTMASSITVPKGKFEFLVIVPDKPGPEARAKRLEVRPQHFKGLTSVIEDGSWKTGGALLSSVPKDDKPESLEFVGSTAVVVADSVEAVKEQLSKDIYATSGVWDLDNVQIYPYKCAFRNP